jgi:hypothetical protein
MNLGRMGDVCPRCGRRSHEGACEKSWHLTARPPLSFWDRVRLLFGTPLYVRFTTPDGNCHAACNIAVFIQDEWPIEWPYVNEEMQRSA